jgi:hypothetical protein
VHDGVDLLLLEDVVHQIGGKDVALRRRQKKTESISLISPISLVSERKATDWRMRMALEDYLHKLVIGLVGQRGEVLERRAVIQLVIVHNLVVGILVHQEIDSVRATVERKGNVSVQSACSIP